MSQDTPRQYTFEGTLTREDSKTYSGHTFDIPDGITEIRIEFDFEPRYATGRIHRNQIDISVDDPDGIRGVWSRKCEDELSINAIASTPGFRTAPIQPGIWTVYVAAHRVLSPDTVHYTIKVMLFDEPVIREAPMFDGTQRVAKAEAGWYRGDLHAHSIHSDGFWDIPEMTRYKRARGLDFVSLSDHNTVTGLPQHRSQTEDGFLALGGMELSTFNGHMLALGSSYWYEWRLSLHDMDIHRIMQAVIDQGDLLIIAHPMAPDEPFCSGCHWMFDDARPGVALGVEVWNGGWHVFNEEGLQQYYVWLNQGHRLVMTAGSDAHGESIENRPRRNGDNVVYADQLSEQAILAAIRKGHSYLSAGPELLLTARNNTGENAMCGDQIAGETITIQVAWRDAHPGDMLRLIVDGKTQEETPIAASGEMHWERSAQDTHWFTAEIRDENGDMWAVSNPIFVADS